jgi:hypothetical protein
VWLTAAGQGYLIHIGVTSPSEISVRFEDPVNIGRTTVYSIPLPFEIQDSPSNAVESADGSTDHPAANGLVERRFVIGGDSDDLLKASFFSLAGPNGRLSRSVVVPEGTERDALRAVHCGTCGAPLVRDGGFRRVLPLPSPFWHEFAELSICHEDFRPARPAPPRKC